jgi:hypothetical protein
MKKVKGNFTYQDNNAQMGSALTDGLLNLAISKAGEALQTDPATNQKAMDTITNTVSTGIKKGVQENMGLIITGLAILGMGMALGNFMLVFIMGGVADGSKK